MHNPYQGNLWVAHGYSLLKLYVSRVAGALEAKRPFTIGFTIPMEGAVLAVDNFVVLKSGRRPDLAHFFIDFIFDGANAVDISNLIGVGNPNASATPYVKKEIASTPAIFPTSTEMERLEMLRDFDPKTRRTLSRLLT